MAGKKKQVLDRLAAMAPASVDEGLFASLREEFPGVRERTLRDALRESGVPLAPLVEGVRQDSFDNLERTLGKLAEIYESAPTPGRRTLRAMVITAKDHATLAARNRRVAEEKRMEKEEMLLWLRTWLENPSLFRTWARLRRRAWEEPRPE